MKKTMLCVLLAFCAAGCKKVKTPQAAGSGQTADKRPLAKTAASPFTVVIIPDTQYYTTAKKGGNLTMFTKQIDWIIENKTTMNIAYVGGVGDIVDNATFTSDWDEAKTEYHRLTTEGIRWGVTVGNHDQVGYGNPLGNTTSNYNARFGRDYFQLKPWYGGNYEGAASNNNDSHYDLFSASGIDFIVIHVEHDDGGDSNGANLQATAVNAWVDGLLATYPSRKAIIITHSMILSTSPYNYSTQGQLLYNAVKARPNVFMMYGGHAYARRHRSDTYNGNTIRAYLCNYQDEANGGEGYFRILQFDPDANIIHASTYSRYMQNSLSTSEEQYDHQMFTTPYSFPTVLTPTADATIKNGTNANTNYGTATNLIHRNSSTANLGQRAYLKFDLSGITQPIKYAKLKLTGNAATSGNNLTGSNCFGTTDGWTETGITWNTAPAAVGASIRSNQIHAGADVTRDYDVTAYVQAQKTADNTASFVFNSSSDIQVTQYSKEYGTAGYRPQLLIYY